MALFLNTDFLSPHYQTIIGTLQPFVCSKVSYPAVYGMSLMPNISFDYFWPFQPVDLT